MNAKTLPAPSHPFRETTPDADWLSVMTLSAWLLLVVGGIIGLLVPYRRPIIAAPKFEPTKAELIRVQLTAAPVAQPETTPPPQVAPNTPPPIDEVKPINAPPLTAVTEPSPKIAFALPVTGPLRIVEASQDSASAPKENVPAGATAPATPVQTLTFGQGEGNQPAPEYPIRAQREGQEGTVLVEFTVGASGSVLRAEPARACPWKLLNDAAVRVVKDRWQFRAGPIRAYQVAIHFQLAK